MNILVTGATGFIGSKLVPRLNSLGYNVSSYDRSSNPSQTLDNTDLLIQRIKRVDVIYHLAGISNPDSLDLFKVNVEGTSNLFNIVNDLNPNAKIIFASTFGVYKIPERGDLIDEEYPVDPRNEYGKSKLGAEKIILSNQKNIVLRFSNIYGPNMVPGRHSVVANFIDSIKNNKKVVIYDKNATRDFLYIDDAVESLVKASEIKVGGVFNICTSEETSMISLVEIIETKLNKKAILDFLVFSEGSGYWRGNYSKAKKNFNWEPKISLSNGLSKTTKSKKI